MTGGTFLSRVGSWFKQAGRLNGDSGEWPQLERDGGLKSFESVDVPTLAAKQQDEDQHDAQRVANGVRLPYWPGKRRDRTLQKLQDGYQQVAGLIESLQKHMDAQDMRTTEISHSLAQLAGSLGQVPEFSKRQVDMLAAIASQMQTAGERTRRIEEVLPRLADAHHEVLSTLGTKLDAARAIDERMVSSLDSFREAVGSLGRASEASTSTLQTMETSAARRDEHVTGLMARQDRRFVMLFAVTVILAAAAIATCVVALTR